MGCARINFETRPIIAIAATAAMTTVGRMSDRTRVGIVAASSVVPSLELEIGTAYLRDHGFAVRVHPQVFDQHFTYAGSDQSRATALFEYANDPSLDILWMARGGYGAVRILPILDELTVRHGPPPRKLLVGYSDVTVLHEYVRSRWRWQTLHAPMPAASNFSNLPEQTVEAIFSCVRIGGAKFPWEHVPLKFFDAPPSYCIDAELIGGNLTLWCSLVGTAYQPVCDGKILFFEDLNEAPYRIDRYITQIDHAGGFDGCAAIILGDFTNCEDEHDDRLQPLRESETLADARASLTTRPRVPLRKTFNQVDAMQEIFGTLSNRRKIPIAYTLPVGHGPNFNPLPLGVEYRLSPDGRLELPFRGERLLIEN